MNISRQPMIDLKEFKFGYLSYSPTHLQERIEDGTIELINTFVCYCEELERDVAFHRVRIYGEVFIVTDEI